jgi:ABC-type antimicrobial peptide transport system permease subunit
VLREGVALTAIGLVAGTAASVALGRYLESLLFGVRALDAGTFLLVPAILLAVALAASWLPARRAMRLTTTEALRHE